MNSEFLSPFLKAPKFISACLFLGGMKWAHNLQKKILFFFFFHTVDIPLFLQWKNRFCWKKEITRVQRDVYWKCTRDISIWDSGADTHLQSGTYLHFCAKQTWKRHNDFEGFSVAVPKNNTGVINTTYKHPSSSVWQFANSQGISDVVMLQAADHHPVMNHISSLKGP